MEPKRLTEDNTKDSKSANPAMKWLYLGIAGIIICVVSLSIHFFKGNNQVGVALPLKVMSQVFGFNPYYFVDNNPPDNFTLDTKSPVFLSNALTFKLTNSKEEVITVTQKTVPEGYKNVVQNEKVFDTEQGDAIVGGPRKGKNTGSLVTKDKTLITIDAPDTVDSSTIEAILRNLIPIPKGLDAVQPQ